MSPSSPDSQYSHAAVPGRARDGAGEPPAKRLRSSVDSHTSGAASRRQAACQPCRLRKVKCDKQRPTCSICRVGGQECEYVGDAKEKISLETATETLLDRFDQLHQEFDSLKRVIHARGPTRDERGTPIAKQAMYCRADQPQEESSHRQPSLQSSKGNNLPARPQSPHGGSQVEPSRDFLQIPPHRASADTVMEWEVFEGKYPPNSLIGSLFKPADDAQTSDIIVPSGGMMPLDDELIPSLIDRFLQNVHTKNPILDVEALVKHGRRCADQGVGWDGRSCLVLLACALGSVGKPFDRACQTTAFSPGAGNSTIRSTGASSARMHAKELQQGDSCFALACRRLGSLKYSLLGAQCHFFAGVYLMYTLRPILSWHYFVHASIFCQVNLRMTHGVSGDFTKALGDASQHGTATDRKFRRLEQSLYWSCFKSECEFRVELPLTQSELSLGGYPDLFPSPPSPISTEEAILVSQPLGQISPTASIPSLNRLGSFDTRSILSDEATELRQHAVRLCNEEESWYYYLTEIALRRIGNRIINTFFYQDRSSWLNIKPLLRMAQEFEAQVSSWSAHLPPAMQHYETTSVIRAPHLSFFNEGAGNPVSQELSWAIDNRLLEMQTWLYQPFLYYLIHAGTFRNSQIGNAAASSQQPRISSLLNPFSPSKASAAQLVGSFPAIPVSEASGLDSEDLVVLHSLIASGIECSLKTIDVRSRGHRHHGLWYDLRSIMSASLVLLAIVKSGCAAWIPGGVETLWGGTPSPDYWNTASAPIGGKIAKVMAEFDFWAGESPDLLRYKEILEAIVKEVRGS